MSGIHQDGDWFAPVTHWRPSALGECPRLAGGQVSGRRGGDVHAPAVSPGQPGDGGSDGANGGLDAQATAEQFVARWRLGAALPANAETRPEMYPGGQRHEKHEADRDDNRREWEPAWHGRYRSLLPSCGLPRRARARHEEPVAVPCRVVPNASPDDTGRDMIRLTCRCPSATPPYSARRRERAGAGGA